LAGSLLASPSIGTADVVHTVDLTKVYEGA
jgi:hypothetical protein